MIAHVIDDIYDHYFLSKLEEEMFDHVAFYTTNIANRRTFPSGRKGTHRLFGTDIFVREGLNRVTTLHDKAEPFFEAFDVIEHQIFNCPIFLRRIDINLQFYGQHGSPHTDGGPDDVTVMLFNNTEWKSEWGGQFQLLSDDRKTVIEEHEYIPGRVIIFPGNVPHRGLAPLDPYVYRYSTVFRIVVDDNIDNYIQAQYQKCQQV